MSFHSRLFRSHRPASAGGCVCLREGRGARWQIRWLFGLLALAMVLGPALGQMHRAAHAGNTSSVLASVVAHNHGVSRSVSSAEAVDGPANLSVAGDFSWVHALFAGHGPAECQLLDQASHGFAGPPEVLAFTAPAPDAFIAQSAAPEPRSILIAARLTARAPPSHLVMA